MLPDENITMDEDLDAEFSLSELKAAVYSQNNSKSPGTDILIAEVFKHSFDIISPFILNLYNKILSDGIFPESWSEGIIVPIFKGGNCNEAKNYRGITLSNILAKIYSKLLVNRLTNWSEKHNKLIDNQFGFQKGKSTTDCIFILHALISKTLGSKKKLYVAFLDWEKMFDRINRVYLWQKLMNENISSKFINAIKSMYSVVKSYIRYNSLKSENINSNIGVKQGDPASSLLCLFFLNDIIDGVNSNINGILAIEELQIFLLLFADDAVVFAHDPASLQSMLTDIETYCNVWGLRLNINKTKIVIFENGRHTSYDFYIYYSLIEVVTSFKYLGVHLFKNGNWNRTQKRVAQHASYSMHNLFIVYNQLDLPVSKQTQLFDTLVAPILNYSAEIWGYHLGPDVESLHSKFCRKVLHVRRSTNLDALYGELGRTPMFVRRKLLMIKYWIKLLTLSDRSLLFKTYKMLKTDTDTGLTYNKNNWAYQIKIILDQCGLTYLWQHQFNMLLNFNQIKQRLLDYQLC